MRAGAVLLLLALLAGCAGSPYTAYKAAHPEWTPMLPERDIDLEETLAAIYAPPVGDYQRVVAKLEILQRDAGAWSEIPLAGLQGGTVTPAASATYAVIVNVHCSSSDGLMRYLGDRVSWYLLPHNRMAAADHFDFSELCVVYNAFEPAREQDAELERSLVERARRSFSRAPVHPGHLYAKGLKLLEVGRVEDATEMLALGDEGFDPSADQAPEFDPGEAVDAMNPRDIARARMSLVEGLRRAGAYESPPDPGARPKP